MRSLYPILYLLPLLLFTACPQTEEVTLGPTPTPTPTTDVPADVISGDYPANATVGTLYEYTPTANIAGTVFSIQNKPDWATFSTGTGTLSGTPTVAGMSTDVKVTGTAAGRSETLTFSITVVGGGEAFSGDYPTSAIVGTAYDYTPNSIVSGVAFSIQNKPGWLTFNTSTGRLNGTPTAAATHADIRVTGVKGNRSSSTTFTLIVTSDSPGTVISGSYPTTGLEDVLYEYTPTALVSGVTFSILNKPSWATFSTSTGKLSGYPSVGTFSNIRVTGSAGGQSSSLTFSISVTGDPLTTYAWHLNNTGQSTFSKAGGSAGQDMKARAALRMGYTGQGIKIAVTDTGLEAAHEDLAKNLLSGLSRNYATNPTAPYTGDPTNIWDTTEDHGTSVSGIIAAKGWNGKGARGIAPNAGLAGLNFINGHVSGSVYPRAELDQTQGDFDIFNQSWGLNFGTPRTSQAWAYYTGVEACYRKSIKYGVDNLRGGKGAIYVRAAGNDFEYDNIYYATKGYYLSTPANLDYLNTMPYQIVVGATNAAGKKSSYSTAGSALWIAGLGGEYGVNTPAMLTTDQSTCSKGFSPFLANDYQNAYHDKYPSLPPLVMSFDNGSSALNSSCNYTALMNGTSAATPSIAGVVALMLEAKPSLSWRDVKHILATTATKVDASFAPVIRTGLDVPGYVYEDGWTTNAAGYHFHNWYGFGRADAEAAVNLAKTYTPTTTTYVETDWAADSGAISVVVPDYNKNGVELKLNVTQSLSIEAVQIQVTMDHDTQGDVAFELYSPQGTKSIVMNGNNGIRTGPEYAFGDYNPLADLDPRNNAFCGTNYTGAVFLSNAFYGENSLGEWKLKVVDIVQNDEGTMKNWKLNIAGH